MEWISIKEKTPIQLEKEKPDQFCSCEAVLVLSYHATTGPYPLIGIARYHAGEWEILGNEGAHSCTGFYELISENITHWMPIPFIFS